MKKATYMIINSMTLYRLVAAPFLVLLIILGEMELFKWLLLISFFTDAVDGFFARKFNTTSAFGAHIDSIADDCTIMAAIVGLCVWNFAFLLKEIVPIAILFVLYLVQNVLALRRFRRTTSFHTYTAKVAAVSQAIFLLTFFFIPQPIYWVFYLMVSLTIIDLLEEIVLVIILRDYRVNIKGLYWIYAERKVKDRADE